MRFSISQEDFSSIVGTVQKGVSSRAAWPILAGIYMEARGDSVIFQTTNQELSIQCTASALVEEEGRAVLPARLLGDIVKNLPDAAVHVKTTGMETVITCEASSFSVKGLDPADFPGFPQVQEEKSVVLPFETFASMAKKVCRVVSKDESRVILTGVLLAVEAGTLRMVATDSYRLAMVEQPFANAECEFEAVVAGSFLADLAALPKSGEDITIALAENQVIVSYAGTVFINRRIEGKYPNYRQLLPASYLTRITADKQALLGAVRRTSLLDKSGAQVRFSVIGSTGAMQLSAASQDVGSIQETVRCQIEGEDVEIGFNSFYVQEGLSSIEAGEVVLDLQGSMKQGVFRGGADEGFLYLVMPVRL